MARTTVCVSRNAVTPALATRDVGQFAQLAGGAGPWAPLAAQLELDQEHTPSWPTASTA